MLGNLENTGKTQNAIGLFKRLSLYSSNKSSGSLAAS
jgi:hypothetical protein